MINIRTVKTSDAEKLLKMVVKLSEETTFMLREPDEFALTVEDEENLLKNIMANERNLYLIVEDGDELVGSIGVFGKNTRRTKHRASIGIGILREFTGQGIGGQLMLEAEKWAGTKGITRLELDVMEDNVNAIKLYKKLGYVEEGVLRNAYKIGNHFVNAIMMAKML